MQPSQYLKDLMPEGWWYYYTYDNGKTELWRNFELKLAYHKNSEMGFWMIDREYGIEDIPGLERMISKIKEHGKITMVFGNNFEFRKHGGEI